MDGYQSAQELFVAATQRHAQAAAAMDKAEALFLRLARGMPEDEAYKAAGVNIADRRRLAAYGRQREAANRLVEAALLATSWHRFAASSLIAFHRTRPRPANANRSMARKLICGSKCGPDAP